jgi:hypothetical protein
VALRLAAALFAGLVYVNALHNPFIYDDYHTVQTNESLVGPADVVRDAPVWLRGVLLYDVKRPIVNASYALDRSLWGPRPTGFHATNIAIHVVNVVLLFTLASLLTEGTPFVAAALFAVHPMMTEAVGYVSGRSELLCATFVLGALICGIRFMRGGGSRWLAAAVACWIAGLLSKETAAVVPLLLAIADWLDSPDRAAVRRRFTTVYLPLAGVAAAAGLFRLILLTRVEQAGQAAIRLPLVLIALDVVVRYVRLLIVPINQTLFHAVTPLHSVFQPRAIIDMLIIAGMLALAWRMRRVDRAAAFGLAAFLLLLAPAALLTVLNVGEPMAEHRVYVASSGLFLAMGAGSGWMVAWAGKALPRGRVLAGSLVGIVLVAFALETLVRNVIWSDPVLVWEESVNLAPGHPRPRLLLGEALEDSGRRSEALPQYEVAVRLAPADPTAQLKLGLCLAGMGRFAEARTVLQEAVRLDPTSEPARRALDLVSRSGPAT